MQLVVLLGTCLDQDLVQGFRVENVQLFFPEQTVNSDNASVWVPYVCSLFTGLMGNEAHISPQAHDENPSH
jgi:hypothetical protein